GVLVWGTVAYTESTAILLALLGWWAWLAAEAGGPQAPRSVRKLLLASALFGAAVIGRHPSRAALLAPRPVAARRLLPRRAAARSSRRSRRWPSCRPSRPTSRGSSARRTWPASSTTSGPWASRRSAGRRASRS